MRSIADWVSAHGLVTVLLAGYLFLSLIVVSQNHTIENQRTLIKQLFGDSLALSILRAHQVEQPQHQH